MRERLDFIDKAKGLLIILVVIGHTFPIGYIHNLVYTFHIPAFFIISGMLLNYSNIIDSSFLSIFKKRLYTMAIPFIFFEIYGCCTYIIRAGMEQSVFGFLNNTLHLSFNNSVNWFIFTLFFAEIIFIVILKFISTSKFLVFVGIISYLFAVLLPANNNLQLALTKILIALFLLMLGYFFIDLFQQYNTFALIISCVFTAIMPLANKCVDLNQMQLNNPLFFLVGSLFGSYTIIQFGKFPFGKILKYLGQNTLLIYGTHNALYLITGLLFESSDNLFPSILENSIVVLIIFAIELPMTVAFNKFFPFLIGKRYQSFSPPKHKKSGSSN